MTAVELKATRAQLAIAQAQLAIALGVDIMTTSRYERGVKDIPRYMSIAVQALAECPSLRQEYLSFLGGRTMQHTDTTVNETEDQPPEDFEEGDCIVLVSEEDWEAWMEGEMQRRPRERK
jgi:transcriptional regulator with XRE-family HTH domain